MNILFYGKQRRRKAVKIEFSLNLEAKILGEDFSFMKINLIFFFQNESRLWHKSFSFRTIKLIKHVSFLHILELSFQSICSCLEEDTCLCQKTVFGYFPKWKDESDHSLG